MEAGKMRKKRRKWPIVLLMIVLLIAAALLAAPRIAYSMAEEKFLAEDYDTARLIYEQLGEFQDSPLRLQEIGRIQTYEEAEKRMNAGDYDAAYAQFASLGDYRDCEALMVECTYQKAVGMLRFGPDTDHQAVAQAREIFLSLGNYKESEVYTAQFRIANTYLSRTYLQSGADLGSEPLWYDAQGRVIGRGTMPEQYAYDEEDRLIYDAPDHIEYDEQGRISKRVNDERTVTYTYDRKGNEISRSYYYEKTKRIRTRPVRYDRKYSHGLLVKETFYDNDMLWTVNLYAYDDQGRLAEHTIQNYGGKPYSSDQTYRYTYSEDGTLQQTEYLYPEEDRSYTETCVYGYIWAPEAEE